MPTLEDERLAAWLRASAVAIWTLPADGGTDNVPYWGELTGQSLEEAGNGGWLKAVHPDDRARAAAAWDSALANHQNFNTDMRIRSAAGIYRWFNTRATPLRRPDGDIDCWVVVCLEIPGLARFHGAPTSEPAAPARPGPLGPSIIRAARAMLAWSADELCERSGVSVSTIRRLEHEDSLVRSRQTSTDRLMQAFQQAGLAFVDGDGTVRGVRWAVDASQRADTRVPTAG